MLIISACLVGINCRYDGSNQLNPKILKALTNKRFIPLCPEQLGGLPTPREPAQIESGDGFSVLDSNSKVIDLKGKDVTREFIKGAWEALKIARLVKAKKAILKDKSPSCGTNFILRENKIKEGRGVLTALLFKEGIEVISAEAFAQG